METEHAAALFHLREALEKTEACPNLLIEARSSFKKGLVILENKADKINEGYEIHENMKKIQKAVEVLKKLLNELESSVVTETQHVTVRETKISGRNADSGVVLSRGSSFLSSDNEDDSNKASITSIRSDSSTWNVHVNDLSGQSPVLDNRVPEPSSGIQTSSKRGSCSTDNIDRETHAQQKQTDVRWSGVLLSGKNFDSQSDV